MLSFIENCGKSTLKRRIWVFSGRTCWQSLQFGTNNCWKLSKSELYKQISSIIFHLPLEDMSAMSAESRRLAVVTRPTFRQKSTSQSHINCSQTPNLQTSTPATFNRHRNTLQKFRKIFRTPKTGLPFSTPFQYGRASINHPPMKQGDATELRESVMWIWSQKSEGRN